MLLLNAPHAAFYIHPPPTVLHIQNGEAKEQKGWHANVQRVYRI